MNIHKKYYRVRLIKKTPRIFHRWIRTHARRTISCFLIFTFTSTMTGIPNLALASNVSEGGGSWNYSSGQTNKPILNENRPMDALLQFNAASSPLNNSASFLFTNATVLNFFTMNTPTEICKTDVSALSGKNATVFSLSPETKAHDYASLFNPQGGSQKAEVSFNTLMAMYGSAPAGALVEGSGVREVGGTGVRTLNSGGQPEIKTETKPAEMRLNQDIPSEAVSAGIKDLSPSMNQVVMETQPGVVDADQVTEALLNADSVQIGQIPKTAITGAAAFSVDASAQQAYNEACNEVAETKPGTTEYRTAMTTKVNAEVALYQTTADPGQKSQILGSIVKDATEAGTPEASLIAAKVLASAGQDATAKSFAANALQISKQGGGTPEAKAEIAVQVVEIYGASNYQADAASAQATNDLKAYLQARADAKQATLDDWSLALRANTAAGQEVVPAGKVSQNVLATAGRMISENPDLAAEDGAIPVEGLNGAWLAKTGDNTYQLSGMSEGKSVSVSLSGNGNNLKVEGLTTWDDETGEVGQVYESKNGRLQCTAMTTEMQFTVPNADQISESVFSARTLVYLKPDNKTPMTATVGDTTYLLSNVDAEKHTATGQVLAGATTTELTAGVPATFSFENGVPAGASLYTLTGADLAQMQQYGIATDSLAGKTVYKIEGAKAGESPTYFIGTQADFEKGDYQVIGANTLTGKTGTSEKVFYSAVYGGNKLQSADVVKDKGANAVYQPQDHMRLDFSQGDTRNFTVTRSDGTRTSVETYANGELTGSTLTLRDNKTGIDVTLAYDKNGNLTESSRHNLSLGGSYGYEDLDDGGFSLTAVDGTKYYFTDKGRAVLPPGAGESESAGGSSLVGSAATEYDVTQILNLKFAKYGDPSGESVTVNNITHEQAVVQTFSTGQIIKVVTQSNPLGLVTKQTTGVWNGSGFETIEEKAAADTLKEDGMWNASVDEAFKANQAEANDNRKITADGNGFYTINIQGDSRTLWGMSEKVDGLKISAAYSDAGGYVIGGSGTPAALEKGGFQANALINGNKQDADQAAKAGYDSRVIQAVNGEYTVVERGETQTLQGLLDDGTAASFTIELEKTEGVEITRTVVPESGQFTVTADLAKQDRLGMHGSEIVNRNKAETQIYDPSVGWSSGRDAVPKIDGPCTIQADSDGKYTIIESKDGRTLVGQVLGADKGACGVMGSATITKDGQYLFKADGPSLQAIKDSGCFSEGELKGYEAANQNAESANLGRELDLTKAVSVESAGGQISVAGKCKSGADGKIYQNGGQFNFLRSGTLEQFQHMQIDPIQDGQAKINVDGAAKDVLTQVNGIYTVIDDGTTQFTQGHVDVTDKNGQVQHYTMGIRKAVVGESPEPKIQDFYVNGKFVASCLNQHDGLSVNIDVQNDNLQILDHSASAYGVTKCLMYDLRGNSKTDLGASYGNWLFDVGKPMVDAYNNYQTFYQQGQEARARGDLWGALNADFSAALASLGGVGAAGVGALTIACLPLTAGGSAMANWFRGMPEATHPLVVSIFGGGQENWLTHTVDSTIYAYSAFNYGVYSFISQNSVIITLLAVGVVCPLAGTLVGTGYMLAMTAEGLSGGSLMGGVDSFVNGFLVAPFQQMFTGYNHLATALTTGADAFEVADAAVEFSSGTMGVMFTVTMVKGWVKHAEPAAKAVSLRAQIKLFETLDGKTKLKFTKDNYQAASSIMFSKLSTKAKYDALRKMNKEGAAREAILEEYGLDKSFASLSLDANRSGFNVLAEKNGSIDAAWKQSLDAGIAKVDAARQEVMRAGSIYEAMVKAEKLSGEVNQLSNMLRTANSAVAADAYISKLNTSERVMAAAASVRADLARGAGLEYSGQLFSALKQTADGREAARLSSAELVGDRTAVKAIRGTKSSALICSLLDAALSGGEKAEFVKQLGKDKTAMANALEAADGTGFSAVLKTAAEAESKQALKQILNVAVNSERVMDGIAEQLLSESAEGAVRKAVFDLAGADSTGSVRQALGTSLFKNAGSAGTALKALNPKELATAIEGLGSAKEAEPASQFSRAAEKASDAVKSKTEQAVNQAWRQNAESVNELLDVLDASYQDARGPVLELLKDPTQAYGQRAQAWADAYQKLSEIRKDHQARKAENPKDFNSRAEKEIVGERRQDDVKSESKDVKAGAAEAKGKADDNAKEMENARARKPDPFKMTAERMLDRALDEIGHPVELAEKALKIMSGYFVLEAVVGRAAAIVRGQQPAAKSLPAKALSLATGESLLEFGLKQYAGRQARPEAVERKIRETDAKIANIERELSRRQPQPESPLPQKNSAQAGFKGLKPVEAIADQLLKRKGSAELLAEREGLRTEKARLEQQAGYDGAGRIPGAAASPSAAVQAREQLVKAETEWLGEKPGEGLLGQAEYQEAAKTEAVISPRMRQALDLNSQRVVSEQAYQLSREFLHFAGKHSEMSFKTALSKFNQPEQQGGARTDRAVLDRKSMEMAPEEKLSLDALEKMTTQQKWQTGKELFLAEGKAARLEKGVARAKAEGNSWEAARQESLLAKAGDAVNRLRDAVQSAERAETGRNIIEDLKRSSEIKSESIGQAEELIKLEDQISRLEGRPKDGRLSWADSQIAKLPGKISKGRYLSRAGDLVSALTTRGKEVKALKKRRAELVEALSQPEVMEAICKAEGVDTRLVHKAKIESQAYHELMADLLESFRAAKESPKALEARLQAHNQSMEVAQEALKSIAEKKSGGKDFDGKTIKNKLAQGLGKLKEQIGTDGRAGINDKQCADRLARTLENDLKALEGMESVSPKDLEAVVKRYTPLNEQNAKLTKALVEAFQADRNYRNFTTDKLQLTFLNRVLENHMLNLELHGRDGSLVRKLTDQEAILLAMGGGKSAGVLSLVLAREMFKAAKGVKDAPTMMYVTATDGLVEAIKKEPALADLIGTDLVEINDAAISEIRANGMQKNKIYLTSNEGLKKLNLDLRGAGKSDQQIRRVFKDMGTVAWDEFHSAFHTTDTIHGSSGIWKYLPPEFQAQMREVMVPMVDAYADAYAVVKNDLAYNRGEHRRRIFGETEIRPGAGARNQMEFKLDYTLKSGPAKGKTLRQALEARGIDTRGGNNAKLLRKIAQTMYETNGRELIGGVDASGRPWYGTAEGGVGKLNTIKGDPTASALVLVDITLRHLDAQGKLNLNRFDARKFMAEHKGFEEAVGEAMAHTTTERITMLEALDFLGTEKVVGYSGTLDGLSQTLGQVGKKIVKISPEPAIDLSLVKNGEVHFSILVDNKILTLDKNGLRTVAGKDLEGFLLDRARKLMADGYSQLIKTHNDNGKLVKMAERLAESLGLKKDQIIRISDETVRTHFQSMVAKGEIGAKAELKGKVLEAVINDILKTKKPQQVILVDGMSPEAYSVATECLKDAIHRTPKIKDVLAAGRTREVVLSEEMQNSLQEYLNRAEDKDVTLAKWMADTGTGKNGNSLLVDELYSRIMESESKLKTDFGWTQTRYIFAPKIGEGLNIFASVDGLMKGTPFKGSLVKMDLSPYDVFAQAMKRGNVQDELGNYKRVLSDTGLDLDLMRINNITDAEIGIFRKFMEANKDKEFPINSREAAEFKALFDDVMKNYLKEIDVQKAGEVQRTQAGRLEKTETVTVAKASPEYMPAMAELVMREMPGRLREFQGISDLAARRAGREAPSVLARNNAAASAMRVPGWIGRVPGVSRLVNGWNAMQSAVRADADKISLIQAYVAAGQGREMKALLNYLETNPDQSGDFLTAARLALRGMGSKSQAWITENENLLAFAQAYYGQYGSNWLDFVLQEKFGADWRFYQQLGEVKAPGFLQPLSQAWILWRQQAWAVQEYGRMAQAVSDFAIFSAGIPSLKIDETMRAYGSYGALMTKRQYLDTLDRLTAGMNELADRYGLDQSELIRERTERSWRSALSAPILSLARGIQERPALAGGLAAVGIVALAAVMPHVGLAAALGAVKVAGFPLATMLVPAAGGGAFGVVSNRITKWNELKSGAGQRLADSGQGGEIRTDETLSHLLEQGVRDREKAAAGQAEFNRDQAAVEELRTLLEKNRWNHAPVSLAVNPKAADYSKMLLLAEVLDLFQGVPERTAQELLSSIAIGEKAGPDGLAVDLKSSGYMSGNQYSQTLIRGLSRKLAQNLKLRADELAAIKTLSVFEGETVLDENLWAEKFIAASITDGDMLRAAVKLDAKLSRACQAVKAMFNGKEFSQADLAGVSRAIEQMERTGGRLIQAEYRSLEEAKAKPEEYGLKQAEFQERFGITGGQYAQMSRTPLGLKLVRLLLKAKPAAKFILRTDERSLRNDPWNQSLKAGLKVTGLGVCLLAASVFSGGVLLPVLAAAGAAVAGAGLVILAQREAIAWRLNPGGLIAAKLTSGRFSRETGKALLNRPAFVRALGKMELSGGLVSESHRMLAVKEALLGMAGTMNEAALPNAAKAKQAREIAAVLKLLKVDAELKLTEFTSSSALKAELRLDERSLQSLKQYPGFRNTIAALQRSNIAVNNAASDRRKHQKGSDNAA